MDVLKPTSLTIAGRPSLYEGEVEVKIAPSTQLLLQNKKNVVSELLPLGWTLLTNCRCIFIVQSTDPTDNKREMAWALNLDQIASIELCRELFRSSRLAIFLKDNRELGIKFHKDTNSDFLRLAIDMLSRKSWLRISMSDIKNNDTVINQKGTNTISSSTSKASTTVITPEFSSANAGINGIVRKQEKDIESVDNLRKTALSDLNNLMKSAEDVVKVIQKYSLYLESRRNNTDSSSSSSSSVNDTDSVSGDINEIEELLQNIGMVSPVTRLSAGRLYYQQLARQIVDLLLTGDRLLKLGGMISLPDLYCVVNRSRGTELLSPDDLFQACSNVNALRLGIQFKQFPSGVMVIQLDSLTDEKMKDQILSLFQNSGERPLRYGLSVSSVAVSLRLSMIVTKEILFQAERDRFICRDDSVHGLYFYLNLFPSW